MRGTRCKSRSGSRERGLEIDAAVENYRLVFAIGHADLFGAPEAPQRDLARRRLPCALVSAAPAVVVPVAERGRLLERRPAIVADAGRGFRQSPICGIQGHLALSCPNTMHISCRKFQMGSRKSARPCHETKPRAAVS